MKIASPNSIPISEAKAHLYDLSEKVSKGKELILSKKGRPAAVLMGYEHYLEWQKQAQSKARSWLGRLKKHREEQKLQTSSVDLIRSLREET
jgi:prevent-host-death family protein